MAQSLKLGLQPCPGLRAGIFTDCLGHEHDLARETPLSPKQAGADPRLAKSSRQVLRLVQDGKLYPIRRDNARVVLIYPAAIDDYWTRQTQRTH